MLQYSSHASIWALVLTSVLSVPTSPKLHTVKVGPVTFDLSTDRLSNHSVPCVVHNQTYAHGETFLLDCKTQCACENGRYGCSSLCPQEALSPRCHHPRLLELPGHCCRQWLCDPPPPTPPPVNNSVGKSSNISPGQEEKCVAKVSQWTACTAQCGTGLSHRESNLNALCESVTETRVCQERRCPESGPDTAQMPLPLPLNHYYHHNHHIRKGHECKATLRVSKPIQFEFGSCRSRKRFRPKYCGSCAISSRCCRPKLSTTVRVEFVCVPSSDSDPDLDVVLENVQLGGNFWHGGTDTNGIVTDSTSKYRSERTIFVNVQWILKCECGEEMCDDMLGVTAGVTPPASHSETVLHRVHRTAPP